MQQAVLDGFGEFITDLYTNAARLSVHIRAVPRKYVSTGNFRCSGYFGDSPYPVLVWATGVPKEQWLPVLVHESCHMDQWAEGADAWMAGYDKDGNDLTDPFWEWISGKSVSPRKRIEAMRIARDLELDCERRAIEKICKYKLNIDQEVYAQKANVYLYAYTFMLESRKWITGLYNNERLWKIAPKKLVTDHDSIPDNILEEFKKLFVV